MKRLRIVLLCAALLLALFSGCAALPDSQKQAAQTRSFTDDLGRTVQLPQTVTALSPAGAVASMLLSALAPECMVTVSTEPTEAQRAYLPARLYELPVTGQMFGGKSALNLETLLAARPQLIIDLGDRKNGMAEDLDALQEQVGIPVIFLEADLAHMAQAFRDLGTILPCAAERAETLAAFVQSTMRAAQDNAAQIPEAERKRVLYTSGPAGLDVNAAGSSQAQVIELIGAVNAAQMGKTGSKAGGSSANLEQLYLFEPDVILFAPGSIYPTVGQDEAWRQLRAIRQGQYYEIPGLPYNWMSNPPSMNMLPGVWWLGALLYPQAFSDAEQRIREYYSLFWGAELTDDELSRWMKRQDEAIIR